MQQIIIIKYNHTNTCTVKGPSINYYALATSISNITVITTLFTNKPQSYYLGGAHIKMETVNITKPVLLNYEFQKFFK